MSYYWCIIFSLIQWCSELCGGVCVSTYVNMYVIRSGLIEGRHYVVIDPNKAQSKNLCIWMYVGLSLISQIRRRTQPLFMFYERKGYCDLFVYVLYVLFLRLLALIFDDTFW